MNQRPYTIEYICFLFLFFSTAERPSAPGDGSLKALQGDLLELDRLLPLEEHGGTFSLAVCMGDTLTHLQVGE